MEMMQMLPGVLPIPGTLPGKMPVAEGTELFGNILTRQQALAIGKKMAEEGDPAQLATWFLSGWPADSSGWSAAAMTDGGVCDACPSVLSSGGVVAHSAFTAAPELAGRQAAGPETTIVLPEGKEKGGTAPQSSGLSVPGPMQIDLQGKVENAVKIVTAAALPLESQGLQAEEAASPTRTPGILERRFADLLRPLQAVSANRLPGTDPSAQQPAAASAAASSAGSPEALSEGKALPFEVTTLVPDLNEQGEFSLTREARPGEVMAAGPHPAGGHSAPISLPPAAEDAVLKHPLSRPVTESQILDQVVGRIAVDRNQETSRMSIKLQPEELGRIEIDLTVEQGRIKAQVVAQNQQVQEVLERHLPRLREAMEQQGLKLDQLQVSVDARAGDHRGFSQQQRQGESPARPWLVSGAVAPIGEGEIVPTPAVTPLGKVSLRI